MDELSDSGSGSQDRSKGNFGNRRKKRRCGVTCGTYSYERDQEFDDDYKIDGSEDGDETWKPSESDVEEVDSYRLLDDELVNDIDNIQPIPNQSSGAYSCDDMTTIFDSNSYEISNHRTDNLGRSNVVTSFRNNNCPSIRSDSEPQSSGKRFSCKMNFITVSIYIHVFFFSSSHIPM